MYSERTARIVVLSPVNEIIGVDARRDLGLATGCTVDFVASPGAPPHIESDEDVSIALPYIVSALNRTMTPDVGAVVIDCMADPGLYSLRRTTGVPVLGPGSCSIMVASSIYSSFSILTVSEVACDLITRLAHACAQGEALASVRSIDTCVGSLGSTTETVVSRIATEITGAIEHDGAEAIVLGCTSLIQVGSRVRDLLPLQWRKVPIIEPLPLALKLAASICRRDA